MQVSELGFGSWGIGAAGWGPTEDQESLEALRTAIELGVNFIDTALAYGDGHSEQLVGQAVRDSGAPVYVATKIPAADGCFPARAGISPDEMFPAEWVIEATETSLRNLGVDRIDLQQLHTWTDDWVGQGTWLDGIARLKQDGKIRHFGISINNHEPSNALRLIETGLVDVVQVIYNVFDQSPEDELFAAAAQHGIGVIARSPLDEGALTGRIKPGTAFADGDFRATYFRDERRHEVWDRVVGMTEQAGVSTDDAAELALRFAMSPAAVSTVIVGMRRTEHVRANVEIFDRGPLEAGEIEKLRPYRWVRDFYADFYS